MKVELKGLFWNCIYNRHLKVSGQFDSVKSRRNWC